MCVFHICIYVMYTYMYVHYVVYIVLYALNCIKLYTSRLSHVYVTIYTKEFWRSLMFRCWKRNDEI